MDIENDKTFWSQNKKYGDYFFDIATGKLPEMFCSKSVVEEIKPLYRNGMSILDVACGAGHYLRSLRKHLDRNVDYVGVDKTDFFLQKAKEAFPEIKDRFKKGNIQNIPMKENIFDIVMANNVILHLPPNPIRAIKELIRVSKKYVIIRTVLGHRNYIVQEIRDFRDSKDTSSQDLFNGSNPVDANYFNIYEEDYFYDTINDIDSNLKVRIHKDNRFGEFDTRDNTSDETGTRLINGMQVSGNLILDWRFIIIEK